MWGLKTSPGELHRRITREGDGDRASTGEIRGEMSREEQTAGAEVLGQDKTGGLVFS